MFEQSKSSPAFNKTSAPDEKFGNTRRVLEGQKMNLNPYAYPENNAWCLEFQAGLFVSVAFQEKLAALAVDIGQHIPGFKKSTGAKSGGFVVIFNSEETRTGFLETLETRINSLNPPARDASASPGRPSNK